MATGGLTERAELLEEALRSIGHLRSELAEIDARLARVEDALYPVDPNSGWGVAWRPVPRRAARRRA
jgi:hypothetical protein